MDNKKTPKVDLPQKYNVDEFSITCNPSDHILAKLRGNYIKCFDNLAEDILSKFDKSVISDLQLYPDLSFPNNFNHSKKARLHFHGVIRTTDLPVLLLLTNNVAKEYSIELDTMDNKEVWIKYCKKFLTRFAGQTELKLTPYSLNERRIKDKKVKHVKRINLEEFLKETDEFEM